MAMSLSSVLNFVIPTAIIIAFLGLIYWKLKEPVDFVLGKIWKLLGRLLEEIASSLSSNPIKEVTYK